MSRILLTLASLFLVGVFHPFQNLQAQSIDALLESRGLSFEQAQQMAQNAGVDPNNPSELAAFARQNGISESQIQQYLVQLRQRENEDIVATNDADLTETVFLQKIFKSSQHPDGVKSYSAQRLTLKIRGCLILDIMSLVVVRIVFSQVLRALWMKAM